MGPGLRASVLLSGLGPLSRGRASPIAGPGFLLNRNAFGVPRPPYTVPRRDPTPAPARSQLPRPPPPPPHTPMLGSPPLTCAQRGAEPHPQRLTQNLSTLGPGPRPTANVREPRHLAQSRMHKHPICLISPGVARGRKEGGV